MPTTESDRQPEETLTQLLIRMAKEMVIAGTPRDLAWSAIWLAALIALRLLTDLPTHWATTHRLWLIMTVLIGMRFLIDLVYLAPRGIRVLARRLRGGRA